MDFSTNKCFPQSNPTQRKLQETQMEQSITPFLKWAGGKRWLTSHLDTYIANSKFRRYIEPFLGSGAVFFSLKPKNGIISDTNQSLIETYCAIRDNHESVYSLLEQHHHYHNKEYYYRTRCTNFTSEAEAAAKFIYLNRTCWNGLYRVNKNGEFNVPIGTKTNVLLNTDNFKKISELLSKTDIKCCDFEETINRCNEGDLIFADPPYTVKHNHNGFIKYNETIFSWDDQVRLSHALRKAHNRGAIIILTNAAHDSVRELYSDMEQVTLSRNSVIAGPKEKRGIYEELLVVAR